MKKALPIFIFLTMFALHFNNAFAQAPSNDFCASATAITSSSSCSYTSGSTTNATESITAISCGSGAGNADDDVWYSFVAAATSHTIKVVGSGNFDAVIDLRSGACLGTNVDCSDASSLGTETLNATGLTVGNTYLVRVYHFGTGSGSGLFDICITHTAPSAPTNNTCASAQSITSSTTCNYTIGSTTGANQSIAAISCGSGTGNADDDVWYSFVAASTSHTIKVVGYGSFDAVIDLRSGACTGTNVDCSDASSSGTETLNATGLTVGTTYLVRVYHFGVGDGGGQFDICITHTSAPSGPSNDICTNAINVTSATTCNYTAGTTVGATQSIAAINCGNGTGNSDDDVWYKFTAVATSHIIKVQGYGSFDAVVDIRSGACTGTNIACADGASAGGLETATATGLTIGNTYFVRVYNYGTGDGGGQFDVCVTHTAQSGPANDFCANAISITSTTSCSYTAGSSTGATQSIAAITCGSGAGNADDDVWYKFTAVSTSHTVSVQGYGGFDAVIDIRSGACTGTNVACADATTAAGLETVTIPGLSVGSVYYIRVYNYGAGEGGGQFDVCVTHTQTSGPANDFCQNAVNINSAATCSYTSGSTLGGTQSIAAITCGGSTGNADDDVWYRFVAQATTHVINVQGYGGFDAVVDLRNAPACTGSNLMCADNSTANGLESITATNLVVGATYVVRVYHFGAGDGGGQFDICITHTPSGSAPVNDVCGNAILLTSSTTCSNTAGSTTAATQSIAGTCTGNGDDDVWYKFTAVATSHTVSVQGYTTFDAIIDIRSNSSCTGTNISCTDNSGAGGLETATLNGLTVGTTYLIRVYNYSAGAASGNFDICVTHTAPAGPPNDLCASAISIASSTTCNFTSGSTTGATQSIAGTCSGTGDDDVWYSFTAVATEHFVKVDGAVGFDAVIDVRSGSCTGTNMLCNDSTADGGIENAHLTGLTVGTTYLVRVYHFGTGAGSGNFQICVTHPVTTAPANDFCTSAVNLTSATSCNYTAGNTKGATQSIPGTCAGNGDDDVWYSFTAVSTDHIIKVQSGAGFDAVVDIRNSPTCSGTNITCSDNSGVAGLETIALTNLTIGNVYMIRLYNYDAGAATGDFQICITHTTQACTYSIAPTSQSFASTGGNGTINVTSGTGCNWTATTTDSWITITSGASGTANGTVTYTVAANSGSAQRTGTITINGQTYTVAQSGNTTCTYTVSPLSQTFTSVAGNGTITITAAAGCNWTSTSNASWITVTSGSTGTSNGTVTYTITANSGSAQRTGTITIAGQVYTVTQNGVTPCSYTINPSNLSFAAAGGNGTFTVTAAPGCAWTVTTTDSWITITSPTSGTGNGTVTYTVSANSGSAQRTGSITVGGQTHTVAQNGNNNCTFTIAPLNQTFTSVGGNGTVSVTTSNACNWAATSNDAWITVNSGNTGTGNGNVTYTVAANTGTAQRVGTITIAGQVHSVTQSGVAPCSYTISPNSLTFTASGGPGTVNVTAANNCNWTATTTDSWITINSGSSGSGNGAVSYTVANNTTTTQRTGTITVAGQTHTVTQSGLQCTYTISPTALSYSAAAGTGTVNVTAASGCSWTATVTDSWITITSGTGTGNGTVTYTVSANTATTQRLGSITIAGQTHTVVQNGTSSCSFTLTPSSQTVGAAATTGNFTVSATSGCNWTAISNDSWLFISSGNTGSGNGTVNFSVTASTATTSRVGTITVGGQIYTVTQSGITCPPAPTVQAAACSLASNLVPNVTYQWYVSGTPIIGATAQFYTANQPGFYSVFVTDITNGCVTGSQPAYAACSGVGIDELSLSNAVNIYPNPSSGNFNISSTNIFKDEKVKVTISNVFGQEVYTTFVTPQNGEIKLTVDKLNPAKGTYTISLTSGDVRVIKRVIVN